MNCCSLSLYNDFILFLLCTTVLNDRYTEIDTGEETPHVVFFPLKKCHDDKPRTLSSKYGFTFYDSQVAYVRTL